MSRIPTTKQTRLIQSWGLKVPGERAGCSRLIAFILDGDGADPNSVRVGDRVRSVRAWQYKYLGARVRVKSGGVAGREFGEVVDLRVRSCAEQDAISARLSHPASPLVLTVALDPNGKHHVLLPASRVKVRIKPRQRRLFSLQVHEA